MPIENSLKTETIKHDKRAVIQVIRGIDSDLKEDWNCRIMGDMCIYHSSGGAGNNFEGDENDKEAKLKFLIKEMKQELKEKGYKEENIFLVEIPYNNKEFESDKDRIIRHEEWSIDIDKRSIERARQELKEEIQNLTKKLQKLNTLKKWEFENAPKVDKLKDSELFYSEEDMRKSLMKRFGYDLSKETPQRILEIMRMGHPDEKGEFYTRMEIIDEIHKRGKKLLDDLGWSYDLKAIYKNRYTGSEETFGNLLKGITERSKEWEELPYIMENWTPKELWVNNDLNEDYQEKQVKLVEEQVKL